MFLSRFSFISAGQPISKSLHCPRFCALHCGNVSGIKKHPPVFPSDWHMVVCGVLPRSKYLSVHLFLFSLGMLFIYVFLFSGSVLTTFVKVSTFLSNSLLVCWCLYFCGCSICFIVYSFLSLPLLFPAF